MSSSMTTRRSVRLYQLHSGGGGGGLPPERLGKGVRPASQNPYPVHEQIFDFSLPYFWPNPKFDTQTYVKGIVKGFC